MQYVSWFTIPIKTFYNKIWGNLLMLITCHRISQQAHCVRQGSEFGLVSGGKKSSAAIVIAMTDPENHSFIFNSCQRNLSKLNGVMHIFCKYHLIQILGKKYWSIYTRTIYAIYVPKTRQLHWRFAVHNLYLKANWCTPFIMNLHQLVVV